MTTLTSRERIGRILRRQPVDRIGVHESFWGDTRRAWAAQGHLAEDETLADHFGLEIRAAGWPNLVADLDFGQQIVEETEETKLVRNGNGSLLRWWKHHDGTPEHVDFLVHDHASWDQHVRAKLVDRSSLHRRIPFESYREVRASAHRQELLFCWSGVNVFELMHPVCGHEHMLIGMALEPEWVKDMCEVYSDLIIDVQKTLFEQEGPPDAIWFYEDMGFKEKPFMSPAMYKDIVWPAHKKTFDFAKGLGLPIIVHSCGFVEPLVGGLIEAGMDCLQAIEVKAGMDLLALKARYGGRISFMGGLDIRALESNDLDRVEAELAKKVPTAMEGSGYVLHTDHSVSSRVNYETYKFFVQRGLEIGTYR
jgi:uroporphyrinogen decarboxylase